MSHDEIRLKILRTLYDKYYDESLGRPLDTNGILEEAFTKKQSQNHYPEIEYLEDKGLLKGEWINGLSYPKWIRITEYGIDAVERVETDLRDLHYRRRLQILGFLYKKFFDGNTQKISTDQISSETKIGDPNSSEIIQEFNYLYEKRLTDSGTQVGRKRVFASKISSYGIDEVENIFNQSFQELSTLTITST